MRNRQCVVTVKLGAPLYARVGRAAKARQETKSRIIREAIATGLEQKAEAEERSFYALTSEFAGCASGPRDLSTNPRHMKNFGK